MPRSRKNIVYNASSETVKKWSGIVEEHEDQASDERKGFNERWEIGQNEEGVDRGMCTQITKLKRSWEKKGAVPELRQRFLFYLDAIIPDVQGDIFAEVRNLEYEARALGLHEAVDKAALDLKAAIATHKSGTKMPAGADEGEGDVPEEVKRKPRRVA